MSEESIVIDPKILEAALKITKKRPKTVVNHIIKHGFITNEELKDEYGYNHPPRAIRDVREEGVPLELFKVEDKAGRKIGAYRFADASKIAAHKLGGRQTFSKAFKQLLLHTNGSKCGLCCQTYEDRYLTIDHRVPYEVVGDGLSDERIPQDFMLLCGTCQRKKSWSCESCTNWKDDKNIEICGKCYWTHPEDYEHLAGKQLRKVEIVWDGVELEQFERLKLEAAKQHKSLQEFLKEKLLQL